MNEERFRTREEVVSQIHTRQIIVSPNGKQISIDNLEPQKRHEALVEYNLIFGEEKVENEKKLSTKLMESMVDMDWLNYEEASGKGHFRFYPKGAIIHSILENVFSNFSQELEANPVITPMVFNWSDSQVVGEIGTFYNNLYHVQPGADAKAEQQILRFGCDIGVFKLMQDANLNESQLPVRIYEAGVLFRSNKPGERSNIQRADSYYLPSIYSFCKNSVPAALDEFTYMHNHFSEFLKRLGLEYSHRFEIDETFFVAHREQILSILKYDNKPALINLVSSKRHYFEVKSDHIVGNIFKSFNIQLDDENAQTYGIGYGKINDTTQEKVPNIIIHSSLASVERWMLIMLNDSLRKIPQELPIWLAPTQVRIITLDETYNNRAIDLAKRLSTQGIRIDIDDRKGKINSKIKKANRDMVPYTILWGRNEEQTGILNLRVRDGKLIPCEASLLSDYIKTQIYSNQIDAGSPQRPVISLSKTPSF